MKKIFKSVFLATAMMLCLSGCNKQLLDLNLKFTKVHINTINMCLDISSWTDYDGEQLQIKLKDGTVMLISSINCELIQGTCPICKVLEESN